MLSKPMVYRMLDSTIRSEIAAKSLPMIDP